MGDDGYATTQASDVGVVEEGWRATADNNQQIEENSKELIHSLRLETHH
jgi:hypothetical protein